MHTIAFRSEHVEDAARLVAGRFLALRQHVSAMPPRWEDVGALTDRLGSLVNRAQGVAAIESGRLIGFLCGTDLANFRGRHGVYSPEWAHGALADDSRRIHEALYRDISGAWAAAGASAHLIIALAHDEQALLAWRWLGFGMLAVDGLRDLEPLASPRHALEIQRATLDDLDTVCALSAALSRHLEAPPTFLAQGHPPDRESTGRWLTDPRNALWLAISDGEAVAYLRQGPANEDASEIVGDPGTTSISGAYTLPEHRGRGIGAALLDRALAWGRDHGYVRCAVDYEPMNTPGARFWGQHFTPVSHGFLRHLDERVVGHARKQNETLFSQWGPVIDGP